MKPKSNRQMRGEWHCYVWREGDERNGTVWPIPVGWLWNNLREKLVNGSYGSRVEFTKEEFLALRSLIHAYPQALDAPRWLLDELVEAVHDAEKKFELESDDEEAPP